MHDTKNASTISRNKRYVAKYINTIGSCEGCGYEDIEVLELHPTIKHFMVHAYSRKVIDFEIKNRKVLCGNCTRRLERVSLGTNKGG